MSNFIDHLFHDFLGSFLIAGIVTMLTLANRMDWAVFAGIVAAGVIGYADGQLRAKWIQRRSRKE